MGLVLWTRPLLFLDFRRTFSPIVAQLQKSSADFNTPALTCCHPLKQTSKKKRQWLCAVQIFIYFFIMCIFICATHPRWKATTRGASSAQQRVQLVQYDCVSQNGCGCGANANAFRGGGKVGRWWWVGGWGGALKLPMHICHAFKWFTNERMRGFVRERVTQREREAFSVRGAFCVRESPQHIDGVGNCVCASSLVIKPGDTTEPLVVWRGGGTEKGEMMIMMMMINVFLIFFLFVNTFYTWK